MVAWRVGLGLDGPGGGALASSRLELLLEASCASAAVGGYDEAQSDGEREQREAEPQREGDHPGGRGHQAALPVVDGDGDGAPAQQRRVGPGCLNDARRVAEDGTTRRAFSA